MSSYQTIGILATGGMGQVELAIRSQGAFQRMYAVKRLRPEHRSNAEFRAMFVDEGRIAGLLRHPNVVSVHDIGEDDQGPFLVMDLVEGIDGTAFIRRHGQLGKAVNQQVAVRIVAQAATGLAAAHGLVGLGGAPLNLIHRDVSPQNIMIGFDGVCRVTDFGIAKAYGRIAETSTGLLKGKAGYMSPEQLRFEDPDQRSDLFSLGVVLYELLAGRRLYRGKNAVETARMILSQAPPDVFTEREDVHPALVELLFELLAKDPAERPANAAIVAERLQEVVEDLSAEEGPCAIGSYMSSLFDDTRIQMAEHRESLVRRASEGGETHLLTIGELHPMNEAAAFDDAPTTTQRRRLKKAWWVAGAGVLTAVAAVWALSSSPAGIVATPLESAPTEAVTPPAAVPQPEAIARTEAQASPVTSVEDLEPDEVEATVAEPAVMAGMVRRRRPRMRNRPAMTRTSRMTKQASDHAVSF